MLVSPRCQSDVINLSSQLQQGRKCHEKACELKQNVLSTKKHLLKKKWVTSQNVKKFCDRYTTHKKFSAKQPYGNGPSSYPPQIKKLYKSLKRWRCGIWNWCTRAIMYTNTLHVLCWYKVITRFEYKGHIGQNTICQFFSARGLFHDIGAVCAKENNF